MTSSDRANSTGDGQSACSLVILHEGDESLQHAMSLCERVMANLWKAVDIELAHWRMDGLEEESAGSEAVARAATADVVVIAGSAEGEFPPAFAQWSESWLARRQRREGALVGLFRPERRRGEVAGSRDVQLHHLALRAGMDYLNHVPDSPPQSIPDVAGWCTSRAATVTGTLDHIIRTEPRSEGD